MPRRARRVGRPDARCSLALKRKVLPSPGTDEAVSSPPMRSTSWREIVSPSPVPPNRRVVDVSSWENGSNSFAIRSGAMPTPMSDTSARSTSSSPAGSAVTRTETSPADVNLTAFETRFVSTWRRRPWSPRTSGGTCSSIHAVSSIPLPCASWARISVASSTT